VDRRLLALLVFAGVLAVAVVAVIAGRGGGSSDGADLTDTSTKPEVQVPDGPPPARLEREDIVTGDGAEAKPGDQLSVQYVGVDYETGQEFDSSWDSGQPFQFQLGSGQVIPGWDRGVVGMRVGGRRQLIVPPNLAYGAQGQPPSIGPNATLVFVIDLVSVQ
jgi:peptidylprolyl isomerase